MNLIDEVYIVILIIEVYITASFVLTSVQVRHHKLCEVRLN